MNKQAKRLDEGGEANYNQDTHHAEEGSSKGGDLSRNGWLHSPESAFDRKELGDIFHVPGGFFAHLSVVDRDGNIISTNSYDLTSDEIEAFVTSSIPSRLFSP